MKYFFPGPLSENARNLMRRLGYGEHRTREGQTSFVKRVGGEGFPRYHAYVEDTNGGIQVNLHVDQKAASYEGTSAHAGEYEGPLVKDEMEKIQNFVASLHTPPVQTPPTRQQQTKIPSSKLWG